MIDPSISLGVKPIQIQDPLEAYGKVQNLMAMRQQQQLQAQHMEIGALELKEHQRQATEGQQLRDLFKPGVGPDGQPTAPPDVRSALPKVFAINPTLGMSMQKSLHEQEKAEIDLQKTKIENNAKKAERYGAIAGSIKDEPSFHQGIATALNEKLITADDAQKLLTDGWNEKSAAYVQQIAAGAMNAKEQHDAGLADLAAKAQRLKEQHDAEMRPFQLSEAEGKATQVTRENDAATIASAAKQGPEALLVAIQNLPEKRRQLFAGVTPQTKASDILRLGMKPHEQAASIAAEKNAENNVTDMELELRAAKGDPNAKAALEAKTQRQVRIAIAKRDPNVKLDHEIGQYGKPFDEIVKGSDSQLDKILDAETMLAGGAVSQALGIPKILTALVSGAGSGVRITQAELNSIAKARGLAGDVEGFFSKLSGNGTLTTEQKKQMQGILDDVRKRIVEKRVIARDASNEMMAAGSRDEVVKAAQKGRDALDAHSAKGGAGSVDPKLKSYADEFFGGDVAKAQAAIAEQRKGK